MERIIYSYLFLLSIVLTGCSSPACSTSEDSTISEDVDKELLEVALTGDAEAQYQISKDYYDTGTAEDYRKSIEFLTKSAQQGHAKAQYRLAHMYLMGHGGHINHTEAAEWLSKAAEQGMPDAQYELSSFYAKGKGVEKDNDAAVEWLSRAADSNHFDAQYELGMYYLSGRRFLPRSGDIVEIMALALQNHSGRELFNERDVELALSWLERAKEHGYSKARNLEPLLSILRFTDFKTGRFDMKAFQKARFSEILGDGYDEARVEEVISELLKDEARMKELFK